MLGEPVLTTRKAEILRWIVREFIETGEPVASLAIARRPRAGLSAASIRNVMADLCDEGFLSQPHTSAGRVPTDKAFQAFVREVTVRRPSLAEVEIMQDEFRGVQGIEDGVGRSSHVLTELTRNVGIAAAIPASAQVLEKVELLPLGDRRVLAVVVTGDRTVHNRVVTPAEDLSADELASIRNYLNYHFSGWVLSEARQELERRLRMQGAYYDSLLKRLNTLYSLGFLNVGMDPEVHLEGAANLVGLDLHLTHESMRELLRALEEKRRILLILDRLLEAPPGEVCVQVGLGEIHPVMKELALIGITVAMPGGVTAKVAVLGPMRMRYEKVMSAVAHVGRTLQGLPS